MKLHSKPTGISNENAGSGYDFTLTNMNSLAYYTFLWNCIDQRWELTEVKKTYYFQTES